MVEIKTCDGRACKQKQVNINFTLVFSNTLVSVFIMTEAASVSVIPFCQVNFAFDDLKAKMNRFTIRFDKWTQSQRERVLKERNEFAKNIAENRGIWML